MDREIMKNYKALWFILILFSVNYLPSADSFQCFECENCPTIGKDESDYIKDCPSIESLATQEQGSFEETSTSSPALPDSSSSSTSNLSITSGSLPSSTIAHQSSSSEVPTTKASVESTTEKNKVTSSWSIFPNSIEESELANSKPVIEDQSYELFSWKEHPVKGVCYVLKLKYEGQEITKRGCGLSAENKDKTCEILSKGEPNSECEVCEGNLCNSASNFWSSTMTFMIVFVFLKVCIEW